MDVAGGECCNILPFHTETRMEYVSHANKEDFLVLGRLRNPLECAAPCYTCEFKERTNEWAGHAVKHAAEGAMTFACSASPANAAFLRFTNFLAGG